MVWWMWIEAVLAVVGVVAILAVALFFYVIFVASEDDSDA